MKTIAKTYLRSSERSIQEAVDHIFPGVKLRRIFPAVYFVNNNLPEERVKVLLYSKELSKLAGDSLHIFKRSDLD